MTAHTWRWLLLDAIDCAEKVPGQPGVSARLASELAAYRCDCAYAQLQQMADEGLVERVQVGGKRPYLYTLTEKGSHRLDSPE